MERADDDDALAAKMNCPFCCSPFDPAGTVAVVQRKDLRQCYQPGCDISQILLFWGALAVFFPESYLVKIARLRLFYLRFLGKFLASFHSEFLGTLICALGKSRGERGIFVCDVTCHDASLDIYRWVQVTRAKSTTPKYLLN